MSNWGSEECIQKYGKNILYRISILGTRDIAKGPGGSPAAYRQEFTVFSFLGEVSTKSKLKMKRLFSDEENIF